MSDYAGANPTYESAIVRLFDVLYCSSSSATFLGEQYMNTVNHQFQLASRPGGDGLRKVDPALAPLPLYLGALGMPGLTAYFGLLDVGQPKAGETVVVSGAAGAVGTLVGQIARIKGARVVGIAGGADKCRYLVDELGFDAAIDYKSQDVKKALAEHCPKGIDVFFDNVGGDILDAALSQLA